MEGIRFILQVGVTGALKAFTTTSILNNYCSLMTINSAYLLDSVAVLRSIGLHLLKGEYFHIFFLSFFLSLWIDCRFRLHLLPSFWLLAFGFPISDQCCIVEQHMRLEIVSVTSKGSSQSVLSESASVCHRGVVSQCRMLLCLTRFLRAVKQRNTKLDNIQIA